MANEDILRSTDDEKWMLAALEEARAAAETGEVPVGAVIVKDGEIVSKSHNSIETDRQSSAHAEMLAIKEAERALNAKWLAGCTMYVTLEPCSMCAGALVLSRIDRLVIGADDPKAGACGSVLDVTGETRLNHRIEITRGVLAEECGAILKEFFRAKRK